MRSGRVNVVFVVGGRYHDFDFARLEILKLLYEHEQLKVRVLEDYQGIDAIRQADALITYTCDLRPDEHQQEALEKFVDDGGLWFALHGTNSIIDWTPDGKVASPRSLPRLMRLLGSQFIAHPPLMDFEVHVTDTEDPLVHGLSNFVVNDELYLSEDHGGNKILLHTYYSGKAADGFVEDNWISPMSRPVLYRHPYGKGEVLYLTLGHCRGKYDMQPLIDIYPDIERCSWKSPVFYELLRRGIRWTMNCSR